MAMIKCPECGKEISDRAENCPNCGFILKKKNKLLIPMLVLIVLVIFVVCGYVFFVNDKGGKSTVDSEVSVNAAKEVISVSEENKIKGYYYGLIEEALNVLEENLKFAPSLEVYGIEVTDYTIAKSSEDVRDRAINSVGRDFIGNGDLTYLGIDVHVLYSAENSLGGREEAEATLQITNNQWSLNDYKKGEGTYSNLEYIFKNLKGSSKYDDSTYTEEYKGIVYNNDEEHPWYYFAIDLNDYQNQGYSLNP